MSEVELTVSEEQRYAQLQQLALDYARKGEDEKLLPMLEHGMSVNLADHKGNALLMLATYHGQVSTVNMLLRLGADPNQVNDRGQTPISGAIFKGYTRIVEILFRNGARLTSIVANNQRAYGSNALQLAAIFGQKEMLELLRRLLKEKNSNNQEMKGSIFGLSPEHIVFFTRPMVKLGKTIKQLLRPAKF